MLPPTEARCHGVIDEVLGDEFAVFHCCATCARFKERTQGVMKRTPWLTPPPADEETGTCAARIE
jgi:hypothetical protein